MDTHAGKSVDFKGRIASDPAPDGIWVGVPLQGGSYQTQKVVGLALGVDDSGQQAVRLVTLDRSGEVEVSDSATHWEDEKMKAEEKREQERRFWNDIPLGLAVCRQIRDNEAVSISDRLMAIELICQIHEKFKKDFDV